MVQWYISNVRTILGYTMLGMLQQNPHSFPNFWQIQYSSAVSRNLRNSTNCNQNYLNPLISTLLSYLYKLDLTLWVWVISHFLIHQQPSQNSIVAFITTFVPWWYGWCNVRWNADNSNLKAKFNNNEKGHKCLSDE